MRKPLYIALLALGLACGPAWSQAGTQEFTYPSPQDLPTLQAVTDALERASLVRIARGEISVEEAGRRRLAVGGYETTMQAALARRNENSVNSHDLDLRVERPIRLGRKAELDRQIGARSVEIAQLALVDARHEAGRLLLDKWFALLGAGAQAQVWTQQLQLLARQLDTVQRRVRAGDASKVEQLQAQAALAQAEQGDSEARARVERARAELEQDFASLSATGISAPAVPVALDVDEATWVRRIVEHNHELLVARLRVEQAQSVVARSRADRTPDPTVGVRYATERSGQISLVGVTATIPFPGETREAGVDAAVATALVRDEQQQAVLRRVTGEARTQYRAARGAFESWQKAELAAAQLAQAADGSARMYQLGENNLTDLLTTRRLANEARVLAAGLRAQARQAHLRLVLDAHRLWPFEEHDGHEPTDGATAAR